jgi:methionyl-tRNA synthetase
MKKIYITTSIPYVNAEPHIGFALELIQADVFARYQKLKGNQIYFVSGTDENSLKNVLAAEKVNIPVLDFVSEKSKKFLELTKKLNISLDDFIRTTEKRHIEGAHKFWISAKKDIFEGEYQGLYCIGCEDFKKEDELIDNYCPIHKTKPEIVKEKNYFFKLSKYQKFLEEIYSNDIIKIIPEKRKGEILNFLKEGLRDFSISRSQERAKNWGIPVPNDKSQVIYVWFDALCNYITALGYNNNSPLFRAWWEDQTTEIWHFIGKDIAKFHCIYWPAMLKASNLRIPNNIVIHGFLTIEGQKISKSLGNVINPIDLIEEFGIDPVRHYFSREFSLAQDGDFSKKGLLERYNNELANGLGNLLSRIITLIERNEGEVEIKENLLEEEIKKTRNEYFKELDDFKINSGVDSWIKLSKKADIFINEKKPWEIKDKQELEKILSSLWLILAHLSELINPFMPETAERIKESIGIKKEKIQDCIGKTFKVKKIPSLFPRK